jgi:predicted DNA-binding protein with PD1-like motif
MQSASMNIRRVHVCRIDPGEDVLASIERLLQEAGVQQAVVLGGYGTLASYHLHWVAHNRIPTEMILRHGEGGFEILAMNGLVVDGVPHIHVTLSTPDGAFGGHLHQGCTAYVLCEVFFGEIEGASLSRQPVWVTVEGMGEGTVSRLTFHSSKGE